MSNYQGHLIGGAVTFPLALAILNVVLKNFTITPGDIGLWLLLCLAGSLFPDIDIHSVGQKILYRILFVLLLGTVFLEQWHMIPIVLAIALFPLFVSHRGLTHTILFNLLIPLVLPWSVSLYNPALTKYGLISYFFFVAGAISHLILDFGPLNLFKRALGVEKKRYRKR